ncbi:hypothetical protein HYV43_03040 [Candidatus Micrarchaeota archaeon]|nr:hypothetical protein [Candidatus Micrarchaeota archaeon]
MKKVLVGLVLLGAILTAYVLFLPPKPVLYSDTYYGQLKAACANATDAACCQASVQRMEAGGYRLAENKQCPESLSADTLKCPGSYTWCAGDVTGSAIQFRGKTLARGEKIVLAMDPFGNHFVTFVSMQGQTVTLEYPDTLAGKPPHPGPCTQAAEKTYRQEFADGDCLTTNTCDSGKNVCFNIKTEGTTTTLDYAVTQGFTGLNPPTPTPTGTDCPQYSPTAPGWCANGTTLPGEIDGNGCRGPPRCETKPKPEMGGALDTWTLTQGQVTPACGYLIRYNGIIRAPGTKSDWFHSFDILDESTNVLESLSTWGTHEHVMRSQTLKDQTISIIVKNIEETPPYPAHVAIDCGI